jgi:hypothetical protein
MVEVGLVRTEALGAPPVPSVTHQGGRVVVEVLLVVWGKKRAAWAACSPRSLTTRGAVFLRGTTLPPFSLQQQLH